MNQIPDDKNICFKKVDYDLAGLLHYIDIGDIGLPDIQRPFVWPNTKVRDLFDSMYRGFPVGYLLFWSNAGISDTRNIGTEDKQHDIPNLLIVDGQQRLTSLYAVFRGKTVIDSDYRNRKIEIGFNPLEGKFEVTDAAIRKNPLWISNISDLWSVHATSYSAIKSFVKRLETNRGITDEEEKVIAGNIDRLFDIQKYPFTALEISPAVDEEAVADIFVRINSLGAKLNQADFILTLLSVFWEEGRKELEAFCRDSYFPPKTSTEPSSFNYFIQPHPGELLRVSVAIGFYRGRLKSIYHVLRGKDPDTDEYSSQIRDGQFDILKKAQAEMLNLTNWHMFFNCLVAAGYRGSEMVNSNVTLIYAYAMFLIGRNKFGLSHYELEKLIGRWYVGTSISSRYIGSFESEVDGDLKKLKDLSTKEDYIKTLNTIISTTLTSDFWSINIPEKLDSSSAVNPLYFAYLAALNKLNAPVLFSNKKVHELLDPVLHPNKKPLDKHHLFPRAWLEKNVTKEINQINQIANFALLEWPDNIDISDDPPSVYVPILRKRFSDDVWKNMCELHALPDGWENMSYEVFLVERRKLIATIIKRGYEILL
jgi:hypothetical protein